MKKYVFTLLCSLGIYTISFAQQFISINPNSAALGQTLNTVVTASGFNFTMGSTPSTWGDFYMRKGGTQIYPNSVTVLDNDHLDVNWTIPTSVATGNYIVEWDLDGLGWFFYTVPNGFDILSNSISGRVFTDFDSSGTQGVGEYGIVYNKVMMLPDSIITFTDIAGDYTFATNPGTKTIHAIPKPNWVHTTDSTQQVTVVASNITGINFGMTGLFDIIDVEVYLSPPLPRCNFTVKYRINIRNDGVIPTNGEVVYAIDSLCVYQSSSLPPDQINGNILTWNYTALLPGELRYIDVYITHPGAGNIMHHSVLMTGRDINSIIVDTDTHYYLTTVVCSFDPNDKTVIPEGVQAPHYTLMSDTLDFLIRFQNTGNDTAFKVVLLDTLDTGILDISSFELMAASHPVEVELHTNGIVTFTFNNILLPDSNVNEPGSHGFIHFRCLPKAGLPDFSVLNNTAYIYFDYNPAIITNTTLNTLVYQIPVGISEPDALHTVTVMPNPVTGDALLYFSNPGKESFEVYIYDTNGRLIDRQEVNGENVVISERLLEKGMYLYHLKNTSGTKDYRGKFVVM